MYSFSDWWWFVLPKSFVYSKNCFLFILYEWWQIYKLLYIRHILLISSLLTFNIKEFTDGRTPRFKNLWKTLQPYKKYSNQLTGLYIKEDYPQTSRDCFLLKIVWVECERKFDKKTKNSAILTLPVPDKDKKLTYIFIFTLLCGASWRPHESLNSFMTEAFIK